MLANRPLLTVNYHSAGGFMFGTRDGSGAELTAAYVDASGYWSPTPGGGGGSPLPYRATGSLNVWARSVGLNTLFIELRRRTRSNSTGTWPGCRRCCPASPEHADRIGRMMRTAVLS